VRCFSVPLSDWITTEAIETCTDAATKEFDEPSVRYAHFAYKNAGWRVGVAMGGPWLESKENWGLAIDNDWPSVLRTPPAPYIECIAQSQCRFVHRRFSLTRSLDGRDCAVDFAKRPALQTRWQYLCLPKSVQLYAESIQGCHSCCGG
jgi:hypothetical protein